MSLTRTAAPADRLRLHCSLDDLKTLPEATAREFALEAETIKGHHVYFVEFDNHLGYSYLVYRSGRILPHATDHALHHRDMWRSALRGVYRRNLRLRLFTDAELAQPLCDYADYRRRIEYLVNSFGYQRDFVSMFYSKCVIAGSEEEKQEIARIEEEKAGKVFNPVGHGWYADADFVRRHVGLYEAVERRLDEKKNDHDFFQDAFVYEMCNHEYGINWQGNYDTLSAFGPLEYDHKNDDQDLDFYFDQLDFTATQRRAYRDAAREYFRRHGDEL